MKNKTLGSKKLLIAAGIVVTLIGGSYPLHQFRGIGRATAEAPLPAANEKLDLNTPNSSETRAASPNALPVAVQSAGNNVITINKEMIQKIGVRTARATEERLEHTVRTTGRFVMDEKSVHAVSLKVNGWVEKLWADYNGKIVEAGDKLLDLYSPELVTTQEEYLLALRNVRRLEGGGERAREDADHLLNAVRWRLSYWDLTDDQVRRLEETEMPQRTLTFYATTSGEVMNKNVAEGQYVPAGQTIMEITDISNVWLIVDVHEKDLPWVKPRASARIELVSQPGKEYVGHVEFIYHMMDAQMRTAKARIVLPGGHGSLLKPGAYATAYLKGSRQAPALVIPEEAVIRTGERRLVIKSLGEGRFSLQHVRTGLSSNGKVQILEGLQEGDEIVSSAQFMIDSEARLLGLEAAGPDQNPDSEPNISEDSN